ncbi:TPA: selenocysteine-specific translation elongation factor [Photobacterium damselae]
MIIVTAGHVDHGKTHLLHALTGTNTARLPEEQKRGLTIDLGYAFMPYQDQNNHRQTLGFIDVPGHEKFLSNMLAGVGTAHHALFIVAADEGLMAQSYEHLTILRLLNMDSLTVVITKSDLVDPTTLQLRINQVENALAMQNITQWHTFTCSAITGEGIDDLKQHLVTMANTEQQKQVVGKGFRLAIDRAFSVKGAGLVVTGTALNGQVKVGDTLYYVTHNPHHGGVESEPIKVRGLHAQGQEALTAQADQRIALNISGNIDKNQVSRGDWLVAIKPEQTVKRITATIQVHQPIKHWQSVQCFHAASHTMAKVALLEQESAIAGETVLAELQFEQPLALCEQDKLLLRDPAQKHNLASAVAIDLAPPNRGKRKPERIAYLQKRSTLQQPAAILKHRLHHHPVDSRTFAWQHQIHSAHLTQLLPQDETIQQAGPYLFSANYQCQLQQQIVTQLERFHQKSCDEIGVGKARLYRMSALNQPQDIFEQVLAQLLLNGEISNTRGWLHLANHQLNLTEQEQQLWLAIEARMNQDLNPHWVRDLATEFDLAEENIRQLSYKLAQLGYLSAIVKDRYCTYQQLHTMADLTREHIAQYEKVETAEFRTLTQLGRKVAIQILEYFDRIGFTKRKFNYRQLRDSELLKD